MDERVYLGATLHCSFGTAPSRLAVLPVSRSPADSSAANVGDSSPLVNIMPFGFCVSMANPMVAAGTSDAQGVCTPMPCVPVVTGGWQGGDFAVMVGNQPALNRGCTLPCAYGGMISVIHPGTPVR